MFEHGSLELSAIVALYSPANAWALVEQSAGSVSSTIWSSSVSPIKTCRLELQCFFTGDGKMVLASFLRRLTTKAFRLPKLWARMSVKRSPLGLIK